MTLRDEPPTDRTVRLRLPRETRLAFAICATFAVVGGLLLVFADDAGGRSAGLLAGGFFGGLAVLGMLVLPRAVTFGARAFTLHRRGFADKQIRYDDITGFGLGRLVARSGRFGWAPFENGHDIDRAFDALIRSGAIPADRLSDRTMMSDVIGLKASLYGLYAMLGLLPLGVGLWLAGDAVPAWVWSGPDWLYEVVLPVGAYLVAMGAAYVVLRRRAGRGAS